MKKNCFIIFTIITLMTCLPNPGWPIIVAVTHPDMNILDALTTAESMVVVGLMEELAEMEKEMQEDLIANQKETITAIQTYGETEADTIAALWKEHAITIATHDNTAEFGPNSQGSYACCSEDLGTGLVQGEKNRVAHEKGIYDAVHLWNNEITTKYDNYLRLTPAKENETVDDVWKIFPKTGTTDATTEDVVGSIVLVTNPLPVPRIKKQPEDETTPPLEAALQHYELLRKMQIANLTIPQRIMSNIVSYSIPTHPLASWYKEMQKARGLAGVDDAVVDGKLSANAVLNTQVAARYGNANWNIDIHGRTMVGALRELLEMESVDLKIQERLLQLDEQKMILYAQENALNLNERYGDSLEKAKETAILVQGD